MNEWRNAYVKRNVGVIRFKSALRKPDNYVLSLFNGDYLYDKVGDENDVECDVDKENNSKYLQRIMFNDKRKIVMYKVLNDHYKRLYSYKNNKL